MRLDKLEEFQLKLRKKVSLTDGFESVELIGGADQTYLGPNRIRSCLVVLNKEVELLDISKVTKKLSFPYIPGFLAFREVPALIEAWRKLSLKPDVLLVDGHGIAHPRGLGIASHVGVLLDQPTIGVAKQKLVGSYETPEQPMGWKPLLHEGKVVGGVVRPRKGKLIFVSPGHRVSVESSVRIVLEWLRNHRLPEPLQLAHRLGKE